MTTVTLLLPLPPRALSPNARPHWARRYAAMKAYRREVMFEAWAQLGGMGMPYLRTATASAFYIVGTRGQLGRDEYLATDGDNAAASLKALWDALVSVRLLSADDAEHLSVRCCVVRAAMRGGLVAVCLEGETG